MPDNAATSVHSLQLQIAIRKSQTQIVGEEDFLSYDGTRNRSVPHDVITVVMPVGDAVIHTIFDKLGYCC